MLIRMLGPFEVVRVGAVATPSAPRLRQVLALLAMHANTAVPAGRVVSEVWPGQPPADPSTPPQTYAYQLRKLLRIGEPFPHTTEPAGRSPAVLISRADGYALHLAPHALDVHRFLTLAASGCGQLAAGRPHHAAELLRAALDVWRGPA